MKRKRNMPALFPAMVLLLTLLTVTAYADVPEIDTDDITLYRLSETEAAVEVPFGQAQTTYWLLLESTEPGPEDADALKAHPGTASVSRGSSFSAYIELPALTLYTDYILFLAVENAEPIPELSSLVPYPFTHLPPPPNLAISAVTSVSTTEARASYSVDPAKTIYYLLLSSEESVYVDESVMRNHEKTRSFDAVAGDRTLDLAGLIPNTEYTLYMMAEDENGLSSDPVLLTFFTTLPVPEITSLSVFGASATEATVEAAVRFDFLPGGTAYMLLLNDGDVPPPESSEDVMDMAMASGAFFEMNDGVMSRTLTGLTSETDYTVYFTVKNEGGLSWFSTASFRTLPAGGGEPPVIVASPAHVSEITGEEEDVHFNVQVSGEVMRYQWQASNPDYGSNNWRGDLSWVNLNDGNGITGTGTHSLSLSASVAEEYFNTAFRCVVTNGAGTGVSEPAVLTVKGAHPILESVCGNSLAAHHPIGLGSTMETQFTADVTVPANVTALTVSDLTVDFGPSPLSTVSLYSSGDYSDGISSVALNAGSNDVYFTINLLETTIYYHITVTREESGESPGGGKPGEGPGGGSGEDPGGGSGEDPGGGSDEEPDEDLGSGESDEDPDGEEPDEDLGESSHNIPPVPTDPGHSVVMDGGGYIEFDNHGIPVGIWEWNQTEGSWIFAAAALSLEELPQTGDAGSEIPTYLFVLSGLSMIGIGITLQIGTRRRGKHEE